MMRTASSTFLRAFREQRAQRTQQLHTGTGLGKALHSALQFEKQRRSMAGLVSLGAAPSTADRSGRPPQEAVSLEEDCAGAPKPSEAAICELLHPLRVGKQLGNHCTKSGVFSVWDKALPSFLYDKSECRLFHLLQKGGQVGFGKHLLEFLRVSKQSIEPGGALRIHICLKGTEISLLKLTAQHLWSM